MFTTSCSTSTSSRVKLRTEVYGCSIQVCYFCSLELINQNSFICDFNTRKRWWYILGMWYLWGYCFVSSFIHKLVFINRIHDISLLHLVIWYFMAKMKHQLKSVSLSIVCLFFSNSPCITTLENDLYFLQNIVNPFWMKGVI